MILPAAASAKPANIADRSNATDTSRNDKKGPDDRALFFAILRRQMIEFMIVLNTSA